MGIITKEVEVKLCGSNIKYYNNLGYDGKHGDIITVKVEDLQNGSHVKIDVLCDYCKKEIISLPYYRYHSRISNNEKIACSLCVGLKMKERCMDKYGESNILCVKEFKEKAVNTIKMRYGTENVLKNDNIKNKHTSTILKKYGVHHISQSDEIKNKKQQTTLNNFGVKNPSQNEEIKEKICQTNLSRYGVPWTMQSPEVREKSNKTLCKNGTQKTSSQQLYLHTLFGGELNYPISYYAADICFPEEKIVFEYDGGFHDGRVKLGVLTQEEFEHKELIRDQIIKREGYKIIRLISRKDYLPSDDILLQLLSYSKEYFSETSHTWITWDIDNSKMINAEKKDTDGVFFDYKELRKIKKTA